MLFQPDGRSRERPLYLPRICLISVNTLKIQKVLAELEWQRHPMAADLRASSPLK